MRKYILLLLCLAAFTAVVYGQDTLKKHAAEKTLFKEFDEFLKANPKYDNKAFSDSLTQLKFNVDKEYYKAQVERNHLQYSIYEFYGTSIKHTKRTYAWQFYSSIIIFIVVILTVMAGLYFAWSQFRHANPTKKSKKSSNSDLETDIDISLQGVKVKSPILGVIILALSLIFFYLYLVYVYPISKNEDKMGGFSYKDYVEKNE